MKKTKMEEDRVSTLPDPLLGHILSFPPTKQAVATSVLSKRWRPLWRLVPALAFDLDSDDDDSVNRFGFVQSVYSVLLSQDSNQPIQTFRLTLSRVAQPSANTPANVSVWVNAAAQRGVEHIDISLPFISPQ